jgi:hypothetical protein
MKSKLAFLAVAATLAAGALLSACTTVPAGSQVALIPPQQLIASFCPVVNADLQVLSASPLLTPDQQTTVAKVLTVNKQICAAGASLDLGNVTDLNANLFPALIAVVAANPQIPNQPAMLLGLQLAQPILQQAVAALTPVASTSAPAGTQ